MGISLTIFVIHIKPCFVAQCETLCGYDINLSKNTQT